MAFSHEGLQWETTHSMNILNQLWTGPYLISIVYCFEAWLLTVAQSFERGSIVDVCVHVIFGDLFCSNKQQYVSETLIGEIPDFSIGIL